MIKLEVTPLTIPSFIPFLDKKEEQLNDLSKILIIVKICWDWVGILNLPIHISMLDTLLCHTNRCLGRVKLVHDIV